jgi:hypothetical protein
MVSIAKQYWTKFILLDISNYISEGICTYFSKIYELQNADREFAKGLTENKGIQLL